MARDHEPTVAFVLSGGASLGAIQVGMLRALYERAIRPDVIVGTSAGAMNGAFTASRPVTVATADALASVWRGLKRGQVFPLNPLTGLLGFPGIVAPVRREDRTLIDGGVANNTPISHRWSSAPDESTCCRQGTPARCANRHAARSPSRCTRSVCSPNTA